MAPPLIAKNCEKAPNRIKGAGQTEHRSEQSFSTFPEWS
jgi:hypothetical protein